MTAEVITIPVLVVGGGPVGLTLGMSLAKQGIDVIVVESRAPGPPMDVKSNHVSARSMEIFRRLEISDAVRAVGLPADYPNDVAYRVTTTSEDLSRTPIPSRETRFTATGGSDTWWPTPEPPHRVNQIFLEPVLAEQAQETSGLSLWHTTTALNFEQDAGKVLATVRRRGGDELTIECEYLVGCDGGGSETRKAIGSSFAGAAIVQRCQSTYIEAPDLIDRVPGSPAWMYVSHNPRRSGTVIAIDGRTRWLVHNHLLPEETEFSDIDRDRSIREILGVGEDFQYKVLSKQDWIGRRLVADRLRDRRVFLCGDAAHLWVPYAGYGMNAGIADAESLAWLLASRINGWGGPAMLEAYERERHPITEQVSRFAMEHAIEMRARRVSVPEGIEEQTPRGHELRALWGRDLRELNERQYCCGGLNFGYYYDESPIIAYDDGEFPPYSMDEFTPSTTPGCRTPHLWLDDGRSLYDAMGPGFTLLRLDATVDSAPLAAAATARGVRLLTLDLPAELAGTAPWTEALVLSRPDRHVAWRGDEVREPEQLLDLICGWHPSGEEGSDRAVRKLASAGNPKGGESHT